MATINDVCAEFQNIVAAVSGVRQADPQPPEQLISGLVSVCYPIAGAWGAQSEEDRVWWTHQVILELSVPRIDLPRAIATLLPYVEDVPAAIWTAYTNDFCGHLVEWIENISYTLTSENWQGQERMMLRFTFRNVRPFNS